LFKKTMATLKGNQGRKKPTMVICWGHAGQEAHVSQAGGNKRRYQAITNLAREAHSKSRWKWLHRVEGTAEPI